MEIKKAHEGIKGDSGFMKIFDQRRQCLPQEESSGSAENAANQRTALTIIQRLCHGFTECHKLTMLRWNLAERRVHELAQS